MCSLNAGAYRQLFRLFIYLCIFFIYLFSVWSEMHTFLENLGGTSDPVDSESPLPVSRELISDWMSALSELVGISMAEQNNSKGSNNLDVGTF